jgi:PAS domain S-box-containing protein
LEASDDRTIRQLFDDYLRMYAARDDRLTSFFSDDFSGFTGGGDDLVTDREAWIAITRQDFNQVREPIRIELHDLSLQSLAETIAVATGFFTIHLPIPDHVLSRETARLVLIFRREAEGWKICHSSISIPYYLVRQGEIYPLHELVDRNQQLEEIVADRTARLSDAVDALQESEDRYRSILDASPDDITITDPAGRIVMVSPVARTMFGFGEADDFLGLPVTDFIVPEDRARAASRIALRRSGVNTGPTEYRALRRDGSTFEIEVASEIIRDAAGAPTGMVLIIRDISERRRAEAEREQLEATTRELQKSESLGRMASAIAHHFNNQLTVVIGNLDLAAHELSPGSNMALEVREALDAARKAAALSGQMLTYLGQSFDRRAPLDLSNACRASLPALQALLPELVTLQTELPAAGPVINASEMEVAQVLANLVANAAEAMGGGPGVIRLGLTRVQRVGSSPLAWFPRNWRPQPGPHACMEVADNGCGIEEGDIDSLFDPFFSTRFAGRGMGLALVLGLVKAYGGCVAVESRPGRGSVFQVYFPIPEGDSASPEGAADDIARP